MFFDTHAHYDDDAFDSDRDELLASMADSGVELIIDPGCDVRSSRRALELSGQYAGIYCAVGIHPEELKDFTPEALDEIRTLAEQPRCVAIGEIGLDYYWDAEHKEAQKELFIRQIELALALNKPIIVHDREAHADCFEIVCRYPALRGVFHCYSGSPEMATELLKRGWYLGFDGPVTYKNARKTPEVAQLCPMDRLLLETDSPYLSPVPLRGKRNDSRNLIYVAQKLAEIKGCTAEEIALASMQNGKRLFGIE